MSAPIVISCEHAGNDVPGTFEDLFSGRAARRALDSHRGHDPGALEAARYLARRLQAPLLVHTTTRLLIEVNRSIGHPRLFSEFTASAGRRRQDTMLLRHYLPHRQRVTAAIVRAAALATPVLHLGVHSFVPSLHGQVRQTDIGLLYDPARRLERKLCERWQGSLQEVGDVRVRRNYPYRGNSDGLTTTLRQHFGAREYLGIELEINQGLLVGTTRDRRRELFDALAQSLIAAHAALR